MGIWSFTSELMQQSLHPRTLKIHRAMKQPVYLIRKKKVYYNGFFTSFHLLPGADVNSFYMLESRFPKHKFACLYAVDHANVYYCGIKIPGADPSSFVVIGRGISKDAHQVYLGCQPVSNDPEYFMLLNDGYFKDRQYVYYYGRIISSNPVDFRLIEKINGLSFYGNPDEVFISGMPIRKADAATFRPLSYGYCKDAFHVYMVEVTNVRCIKEAHPDSFQVINQYYSMDKNYVYHRGIPFTDSCPGTFQALNRMQQKYAVNQ